MIFIGFATINMCPSNTLFHTSNEGEKDCLMRHYFFTRVFGTDAFDIEIQGQTDPVLTLVRPLFVSPEASLFEPGVVYPYSPLSAISKSPLAGIEVLPDKVGSLTHSLIKQPPFVGLSLEFLDDPSGINFS